MDSDSAASFTPSAIYFTRILYLRSQFTYLKQQGFSVSGSLHVASSLCQASMTSCQTSKTPSYPANVSKELVLTNLSQDALYFSFISLITHCCCSVAQLCLTVCDPMDYSLPRSSIHGILQARVLEWVAISFSRGSSRPRDWTWVSRIAGRRFTFWATKEVLIFA